MGERSERFTLMMVIKGILHQVMRKTSIKNPRPIAVIAVVGFSLAFGQSLHSIVSYQWKLTQALQNPLSDGTCVGAFHTWNNKKVSVRRDTLVSGRETTFNRNFF
jgi:hypothetical protein